MAITVYSGAFSGQAWPTDKVRITTGTNSVTAEVNLTAKPTANVSLYLYNNGNQAFSVPVICPANTKTELYIGVGNQLSIAGGNSTAAAIGTASSGDAGVMD